MKTDYRKKHTVYLGIESVMMQGGDDAERADRALEAFKRRSLTPEEFEYFYLVGVDARQADEDERRADED